MEEIVDNLLINEGKVIDISTNYPLSMALMSLICLTTSLFSF